MKNYDLTEIINILDDIVIFRGKIKEKTIAKKIHDDLEKLGDRLEDALFQLRCQIRSNKVSRVVDNLIETIRKVK